MRPPHKVWESAPPDEGPTPGGIRARALQAIERRGRSWVVDERDSVVGLFNDIAEAKQASRQAAGGRR
jgi:hypothetical protein